VKHHCDRVDSDEEEKQLCLIKMCVFNKDAWFN